MNTQIILTTNVEKLGAAGETVKVTKGYARNFLIPQKLGLPATPANLKRFAATLKKQEAEAVAQLAQAKELETKLTKQSFTISAAAGPDEKLFGSVTSADIAEALQKEGIEIDRKKIVIERPIHSLGVYDVDVKLHPAVSTKVKVWVVAAEGAAAPDVSAQPERPKKASKKK